MSSTVYFWQNVPSPHQVAYQRELAAMGYKVMLIADTEMLPERAKMGWTRPDLGEIDLRVGLSWEEKKRILEAQPADAVNFVSGVRGCRDGGKVTDFCIAHGLRVGWIAETWDARGWKGALRTLLYHAEALKYRNKLSFILAMGDKGVSAYTRVGYPKELVKRFWYVVDTPPPKPRKSRERRNEGIEIIYVGSLYHGKGIDLLFKALAQLRGNAWTLRIVGEERVPGEYRGLAETLGIADRIRWDGVRSNAQVFDVLAEADLLVLPSRYDGWGAVVNEALLSGVPVVCSDAAGAACVLDGELGAAFPCGEAVALRKALERQIRLGPVSPEKRERIRALAETRISATTAAKFLLEEILSDAK